MNTKTIFWNVDTQHDFMRPEGKLYVSGAETIEGKLAELTQHAALNGITVVNTADWHNKDTKELSKTPDYVNTFPEHCMQFTPGAQYVFATHPENPVVVEWTYRTRPTNIAERVSGHREIVIRKDAFDVFRGNEFADEVVKALAPKTAVVYGVATNFCVNYAVEGLVKRGVEVYVVRDAIKEIPLPNEPRATFDKWEKEGVKFTTTEEVLKTYRR